MIRLAYALILLAFQCAFGGMALFGQSVAGARSIPSFDPGATFTVAQIREDIAATHRALEEVHPSLYRHIRREELDSLFSRAIDSARRPRTYAELTRYITPLVTAVGCAHTILLPSESYDAFKQSTLKSFPFAVKVIDEKLYLTRNYSGNGSIAPGSQIEAINGIPVSDILPIE